MNKAFLNKYILSFLVLAVLNAQASAQTMQATIKPGRAVNTVDIYVRASSPFSQKDESMTLVLAVPERAAPGLTVGSSGVTPNSLGPVAGITGLQPSFLVNNFGAQQREVVVSNEKINNLPYYIYTFIFAGTAVSNHEWKAGEEQKVFSIQFNGSKADFDVNSCLLVNLPKGGARGIAYWYFQVNTLGDVTNYRVPFYQNTRSTLPLNGGTRDGSALSRIGAADDVISLAPALEDFSETVVYPTITKGPVNVKLPLGYENASISVCNAAGKEITADKNKKLNRYIDLSKYSSGTYFIKVLNKDKVVTTTQVVVQR